METTTTVLSHKEADTLVKEWEVELQSAQAALAQHEQGIGQYALSKGVDAAHKELTRLQVEVARNQTGLAVAKAQCEMAQRYEQHQTILNERAEVDQLEDEVAELNAFVKEYGQKVAQAQEQIGNKLGRARRLLDHTDELVRLYGEPA